ncbi:biotin-dependent carboxylase-like uncharacterized protein [Marmoricola sp. URHA0025 HA25]
MREGSGERAFTVVDPGALTTVQDAGRPGWAHLGVPRSGALDAPAMRLANRLVGNPESLAVLETTSSGVVLRPGVALALAVTGAHCEVHVDGRSAQWGAPVPVPAGAEVRVGTATEGLRSYVALAGGVDVPAVLGSRSTDLLSGLGPRPLRAGDRVALGAPGRAAYGTEAVPRRRPEELRLVLGPRADWFTTRAVESLDGATYEVLADSNRVGLRLGGVPIARSRDDELPSEGMVLGAVQVPPNGQPVVLLHDHPTTGGYPVVAVVVADDLPVCAQARPGERVTLRVVG